MYLASHRLIDTDIVFLIAIYGNPRLDRNIFTRLLNNQIEIIKTYYEINKWSII